MGPSDVLPDAAIDPDLERRFTEAMLEHGRKAIDVHTDVAGLFAAIGLVQLAMRHPQLAADPEHTGFSLVSMWAKTLAELDPVFGEVVKLGWNQS